MKRIMSIVIDLLLGATVVALIERVILPSLLDGKPWAFGPLSMGIIIGGAIVWALIGIVRGASLGRLYTGLDVPDGQARTIVTHLGWIALTTCIIGGWIITDISPIEFLSGEGLQGAGRIFGALLTPEFDVIGEALAAMVVTIFTAFMATVVAVPLSFLLSFPAARNVMATSPLGKTIYMGLRIILNIMRSMEPIIWAIIFSVWVGIGPFAGMLALVIHTVASLTKQYSEQIEDVNAGPIEAISATGANRIQVLWFAIVPQCVIPFLSFTIYRWDINVRMATIIGFVGGGGIGTLLTQYQGLARYHEVGTLVILITAVVWILDVVSARVREALR
ncbi:MAG: phosphonate ABC transporter, permease protein PhnE [Ignavibacteria bacterium]|nr:phosphonate ABC transporter, permease protein PhnE [Ignavibacteria bacterium]